MYEEEEKDMRFCPECGEEVERCDMNWTYDCHGITMQLLCWKCWQKVMDEKGYDGEYYDENDECLDYEY